MGSVLYASATQVWMVIVALLLVGVGLGSADGVSLSYWGEMTIKWDEIRQEKKKKPVTDVLYVIFLFTKNMAFIVSFGKKDYNFHAYIIIGTTRE